MLGIRDTNAPWSLDLLYKSDTVVLFPPSTIHQCRQVEAAVGKLSKTRPHCFRFQIPTRLHTCSQCLPSTSPFSISRMTLPRSALFLLLLLLLCHHTDTPPITAGAHFFCNAHRWCAEIGKRPARHSSAFFWVVVLSKHS